MKLIAVIGVTALMCISARAADETAVRIELHRPGANELTPAAKAKAVEWAEKILKSSNRNTAHQFNSALKPMK